MFWKELSECHGCTSLCSNPLPQSQTESIRFKESLTDSSQEDYLAGQTTPSEKVCVQLTFLGYFLRAE